MFKDETSHNNAAPSAESFYVWMHFFHSVCVACLVFCSCVMNINTTTFQGFLLLCAASVVWFSNRFFWLREKTQLSYFDNCISRVFTVILSFICVVISFFIFPVKVITHQKTILNHITLLISWLKPQIIANIPSNRTYLNWQKS